MGKGGLSCGGTVAKWILFCFNFIFWLCSLAILSVGIWLAVDPDAWEWVEVIEDAGMDDALLAAAVWTMIGIGCFMFIVGFAGCWGACQESYGCLCFYVILVTLCLLVEITVAILAIVFATEINESVEGNMQDAVQEDYGNTEHSNSLTEAWDAMQQDLECCGSVDYRDYNNSYYHQTYNNSVPESCCIYQDGQVMDYEQCKLHATNGETESDYLYTTGCYVELKDILEEYSYIIVGVMLGLALLQFLGLCFACCVKGDIAHSENFV